MQARKSFLGANVTSLTAYTQSVGLIRFDGYYYGPGGEWLQIFDSATNPSTGTLIKEFYLPQGGQYTSSMGGGLAPIRLLTGLIFAISSTNGTYTASTSKFDITGEVEEWETSVVAQGLSSVSGVAVQTQRVWAQAAGAKTLYEVDITYQSRPANSTRWLLIYADDAMTQLVESIPLQTLTDGTPSVANYTKNIKFGIGGHSPLIANQPSANGNNIISASPVQTGTYAGCSLAYSTSASANVAPLVDTMNVTVYYL